MPNRHKINAELAKIFYKMSSALAAAGVDWKPAAYRKAAASIDALDRNIRLIHKTGGLKALETIDGVGENIAKKIEQYLKTGKIKQYETLKKTPATKTPKDRGPARAYVDVKKVAEKVVKYLKNSGKTSRITVAGSLRRKKKTVRDIDLLATSKKSSELMKAFTSMSDVKRLLAKGLSKTMLVLENSLQVDLRVVPPESWGAALLYFTGSKQYNIDMRKTAIRKGYKLNEYGLFDRKTGERLAGKTEKEIFSKLGLKYRSPEQRK